MAASDAEAGRIPSRAARVGDGPPVLTPAGYAWEFLRRNPHYRQAYNRREEAALRVDRRWGLRFFVDPFAPAPEADVYWRADAAPAVVVTAAPKAARTPEDLTLPQSIGDMRVDDEGVHTRVGDDLQLSFAGHDRVAGSLAVVLSFDRDFSIRLQAARRLYTAARSGHAPPVAMTSAQRLRLDRCLSALDGSLERQSYRAIAEQIFGLQAINEEPWKTATLRDATIRLVRTGRELMRGGYLTLLRRS